MIAETIQLALTPVFVLVAIGNIMTMLAGRLARVVDRARYVQQLYPETTDKCLTEYVDVEYEFGTWNGIEAHKHMVKNTILQVFSFTHHIISNDLIEIDGNTAIGEYRVTGSHGLMENGRQRVI